MFAGPSGRGFEEEEEEEEEEPLEEIDLREVPVAHCHHDLLLLEVTPAEDDCLEASKTSTFSFIHWVVSWLMRVGATSPPPWATRCFGSNPPCTKTVDPICKTTGFSAMNRLVKTAPGCNAPQRATPATSSGLLTAPAATAVRASVDHASPPRTTRPRSHTLPAVSCLVVASHATRRIPPSPRASRTGTDHERSSSRGSRT